MNLAFHSLLAVLPVAAVFFFLVILRWPARSDARGLARHLPRRRSPEFLAGATADLL